MKLAICDDEKRVRDVIAESVREVSDNVEIELYADTKGILAADFDADILFLDIQMPGIDGMQAAKLMREAGKKTVIVFVTALEEQVFSAFDVGALNYIVKPFGRNRIREVIKKAIEQAEENRVIRKSFAEREWEKEPLRFLTVKAGGCSTRVILSEIAYAEIYDRRIILHMTERGGLPVSHGNCSLKSGTENTGSQISYYGRISELESIAGKDFFRVHRAFLINLGYVKSYDSRFVRVGDADIPVARGKYQALIKAYLSYYTRREGL